MDRGKDSTRIPPKKRSTFWDVQCGNASKLQPLERKQVIHQQRMAADVFALSLGLGEAEQRGLQVRFSKRMQQDVWNRCTTMYHSEINSDFQGFWKPHQFATIFLSDENPTYPETYHQCFAFAIGCGETCSVRSGKLNFLVAYLMRCQEWEPGI